MTTIYSLFKRVREKQHSAATKTRSRWKLNSSKINWKFKKKNCDVFCNITKDTFLLFILFCYEFSFSVILSLLIFCMSEGCGKGYLSVLCVCVWLPENITRLSVSKVSWSLKVKKTNTFI